MTSLSGLSASSNRTDRGWSALDAAEARRAISSAAIDARLLRLEASRQASSSSALRLTSTPSSAAATDSHDDTGFTLYDGYSLTRPIAADRNAASGSQSVDAPTAVPTAASAAGPAQLSTQKAPKAVQPEALPYGFDAVRVMQLVDNILNARSGAVNVQSTRQAGDLTINSDDRDSLSTSAVTAAGAAGELH